METIIHLFYLVIAESLVIYNMQIFISNSKIAPFAFHEQVLNLEWASGIESLKCLGRVDVTLNGSFSDMVLSSSQVAAKKNDLLFVLSNPGHLHLYDDGHLSALMYQQEKKTSLSTLQYPVVIPTVEPQMTVGKLGLVCQHGKLSEVLSQVSFIISNPVLCSLLPAFN